jgi:hypothetical protein
MSETAGQETVKMWIRITSILLAAVTVPDVALCTERGLPGKGAGVGFELKRDSIFLPGWDDASGTNPAVLMTISPSDFEKPAHVYRERLILEAGDVVTTAFTIPSEARELVLIARGRAVEWLFPRIEISLIFPDNTTSETVLFSGYVQSVSLDQQTIKLDSAAAGKTARLKISFKNTAAIHDRRVLYVSRLFFR